ncbi:hypothetical protein GOP47_0023705 [Adiantum capillus-veneris]|uniref:Protein kinase domain-containing protein n=1 Tax=Adiantum capillus-veneris TaxID=13818 RepID=A0A9D4U511_ADICA|nr:hypothetical protein GOP47_0023705 [Adiantum capillus-veneris]
MHTHNSPPAPHPPTENPFTPILPFTTPSDLASLYELGSELGRGQFGIIRSCKHQSLGTIFACKSISKLGIRCSRDIENVIREVLLMKKLSKSADSLQACPTIFSATDRTSHRSFTSAAPACGIVGLHDVVEDSRFVHLIMDICQGGDLFDRIVKRKCYPEAQAASLLKSLLETLQLCHSMGVMHRDLKPENILFFDESDASPIKLADFGLALEFTPGQKVSGMAGSTFYMAPEMLRGEEYTEQIDMWSAGVILYVLLSGVPPFWEATEQETLKAIQEGDLSFPPDPWAGISSSAKDLIIHIICADAEARLSPAQALKHPWILQHAKKARQGHRLCTALRHKW